MTTPARSPYAGHRFPAEVISHAIWLYFRFPLSLRLVEELLAVRGIHVSHETVRQWARKFGRKRPVFPPLLIGLRSRSWLRRWARVSTANGGHFVARIDAASAQISPLERRGEALHLPGDESARRLGRAGGAATCAERQPDLQMAQG